MNDKSLLHSYQRRTRELLVERALGRLTIDDEGEIAEDLDDIWRMLSAEDRQAVEGWLKTELAPLLEPPEHSPVGYAIESADLRAAPRSAA